MFVKILQLWTGPLPLQELFPDRKINFFLHWFIHPIKRRLAKYYLVLLKTMFGLKVIAITGSSGKTTTAGILYSVLSGHRPTVKTFESVTTTYNLPTTILSCTPKTRYLILEMGVEYPGDMDFYTWLAKPDIAVILNISQVHSSFLGSTSEIFSEKSKLLSALPQNGLAIINADDKNIDWPRNSHTLRFGIGPDCFSQIVSAVLTPTLQTKISLRISGKIHTYTLPLIGKHLASNLASATAIFELLSIPEPAVIRGLSDLKPPPHRLNLIRVKSGYIILDDSYNASPISTTQSLHNLSEISKITKKNPVVIFGQMNELGNYEKPAHEQIGRLIKQLKIKHLFTLGPATAFTIRTAGTGKYFDTYESLAATVRKFILPSHCVLIKGSNSWHLERLLDQLI